MIDIKFHRQVSDCKKAKSDDMSHTKNTILSQRSYNSKKECRGLIDKNKEKYNEYNDNGILEYMDEYHAYFY
jgi:hypothetical protein